MEKILALVSLLVVAAACAAPPTNRETASNTNAKVATESKSPASVADDEAVKREKEAWDAIKRKDFDAFANMLASEYIEVGSEAVYGKDASVKLVKGLILTDATFSDWKALPIDKDALVVTYTANIKGSFNGEEFQNIALRASSAWVNREGKWLSIYHQETDVKPAPAPPTVTKQPPKATSTPAPTAPPPVPGADPVANEKMIWETLKNNNSDAFASLLAPDSVEVEQDAVYDKAASVKSVSQLDLSKAVLSDFKAVKFDSDASLVTYMVKIPGVAPGGERHSTIWTKREGKWLGLFHQGTPVEKPAAAAKAPAK